MVDDQCRVMQVLRGEGDCKSISHKGDCDWYATPSDLLTDLRLKNTDFWERRSVAGSRAMAATLQHCKTVVHLLYKLQRPL
jgi:hypothetical protein